MELKLQAEKPERRQTIKLGGGIIAEPAPGNAERLVKRPAIA
jgi:hypothetical protein